MTCEDSLGHELCKCKRCVFLNVCISSVEIAPGKSGEVGTANRLTSSYIHVAVKDSTNEDELPGLSAPDA
jgi:outer membrane receptor for monomeric catechols